MKTINPEHIEKVIEVHNSGPYLKLLSIKVRGYGVFKFAAQVH